MTDEWIVDDFGDVGWDDDLPPSDYGDIVKMLDRRICKDYGRGDHGHTDCLAMSEAAKEIEQLRAWKAEALEVLAAWERVWEAVGKLGKPGPLGESKPISVLRYLEEN